MPVAQPNRRSVAVFLRKYGLPGVGFLCALGLVIYHREFLTACRSSSLCLTSCKNLLQEWVQAGGSWGPVIFILIQAAQVVIAPIPGEVTGVMGGFLFGSWLGFVYSSLGLVLGSVLAFFVGRFLGKVLLTKIIPEPVFAKFDFLMERQGGAIAFLLFLIPAAPKDYLCFLLGVSKMPWLLFLVIVTFGRMPVTLALSVQGAQISQERYLEFLLLCGACLVIVLVLILFRGKLYQWLRTGSPWEPLANQPSQTELKR